MSRLEEIGIKVVPPDPPDGSGNGLAILHEIADLLSELVAIGKTSSIDLHGIPMNERDYEILREVLGEGEIQAVLDLGGPSEVRETGCHGVWWIVHRNDDDQVLAETIEITLLPAILATQPEDVKFGLERLKLVLRDSKN